MQLNNDESINAKQTINDYSDSKEKKALQDLTQTKELLKVLSSEVGVLVEELLSSLYDVKLADKFADSIVAIYKKLLSEGLSNQTVEKIVLEYSTNIEKIVSALKRQQVSK